MMTCLQLSVLFNFQICGIFPPVFMNIFLRSRLSLRKCVVSAFIRWSWRIRKLTIYCDDHSSLSTASHPNVSLSRSLNTQTKYFSAIECSSLTQTLFPQVMHEFFAFLLQIMQAEGNFFLHEDNSREENIQSILVPSATRRKMSLTNSSGPTKKFEFFH